MGSHEFILLAFLAKIMVDKIITDAIGICGNIISGITLMFHVYLIDRIPTLRTFIQGDIIPLMKNDTVDELALKHHHVNLDDLNHLARKRGYRNYYDVFEEIFIEKKGHLSGTLK